MAGYLFGTRCTSMIVGGQDLLRKRKDFEQATGAPLEGFRK